jgi:hypothetical protein
MTEFELISLIYTANEAGNMALALYLTTVSGYLIVAYSVGAKLTRGQVALTNALFVFFSFAFTFSATTSFLAMTDYERALSGSSEYLPQGYYIVDLGYTGIVIVCLSAGIIGSLLFMRNIRSSGR